MDEKRHCTPQESLRKSLKEVKLMREGKISKPSYSEYRERMKTISTKAEALTGEDGMIELDPSKDIYKEWFEGK